jgi:hypothetical protein
VGVAGSRLGVHSRDAEGPGRYELAKSRSHRSRLLGLWTNVDNIRYVQPCLAAAGASSVSAGPGLVLSPHNPHPVLRRELQRVVRHRNRSQIRRTQRVAHRLSMRGRRGPTSLNEPNVGSNNPEVGPVRSWSLLREDASEHVRRRRARTLMDPDRAASKVLLELDLTSSCKRWPLHCTSHCHPTFSPSGTFVHGGTCGTRRP